MQSKLSESQKRSLATNAWVEVADLLDLQLSPLGRQVIEKLAPQIGEEIVDLGCGAGQSVLQLADEVGPRGSITGVDFAPALLDVARRRASGRSNVRFIECDASTLDFPDHSFDCAFSRFGVMAFSDPVSAFRNLRRVMKHGGRLGFVCWRSFEENELDALPIRAAGLSESVNQTPFSFRQSDRIRTMLEETGFREISIEAHDEMVSSGGKEEMTTVFLKVGALGKVVRENPALRPSAEARLRTALTTRADQDQIALKAAIWIVTARA